MIDNNTARDNYPGQLLKDRRRSGLFLIAFGLIFLLANSGATLFGYSPWILMALMPAAWLGLWAYASFRRNGRLSGRILIPLIFSLLPLAYILAGRIGFDVAAIWPLAIIVLGASFILLQR